MELKNKGSNLEARQLMRWNIVIIIDLKRRKFEHIFKKAAVEIRV